MSFSLRHTHGGDKWRAALSYRSLPSQAAAGRSPTAPAQAALDEPHSMQPRTKNIT